MAKLKIKTDFYKIGMDEVEGLETVLREVMAPVVNVLNGNIYWSDLELTNACYKSRDGFIPYGSNCGGIQLGVTIPKCEESNFSFLEFGECDGEECDHESECFVQSDGHLDARLSIWLKFEGLNEQGEMSFYLVMSGGNQDVPYFRESKMPTIFESEFTAKTLKQVKTNSKKHINKLIKVLENK